MALQSLGWSVTAEAAIRQTEIFQKQMAGRTVRVSVAEPRTLFLRLVTPANPVLP